MRRRDSEVERSDTKKKKKRSEAKLNYEKKIEQ
jgi:hypothetical protein